jgi:hypothetical protein
MAIGEGLIDEAYASRPDTAFGPFRLDGGSTEEQESSARSIKEMSACLMTARFTDRHTLPCTPVILAFIMRKFDQISALNVAKIEIAIYGLMHRHRLERGSN